LQSKPETAGGLVMIIEVNLKLLISIPFLQQQTFWMTLCCKESVRYWKNFLKKPSSNNLASNYVFSQFFFILQWFQADPKLNLCNLMPHGPELNFLELKKCIALVVDHHLLY